MVRNTALVAVAFAFAQHSGAVVLELPIWFRNTYVSCLDPSVVMCIVLTALTGYG